MFFSYLALSAKHLDTPELFPLTQVLRPDITIFSTGPMAELKHFVSVLVTDDSEFLVKISQEHIQ